MYILEWHRGRIGREVPITHTNVWMSWPGYEHGCDGTIPKANIGASGQVGTPLTKGLLSLGHAVIALTRNRKHATGDKLNDLQAAGGKDNFKVANVDMEDSDSVGPALQGAETLICAVPGSKKDIITKYEPIWLDAAVKAGIKRFVPTEFGCHTQNLEVGDGILFDYKKDLHEKIFKAGIGWTFFYTGGIFDYFLPNLRFFKKITAFGDLDIPIYVHEIEDIGAVAAMALTDYRALNCCVQLDYNSITQKDMLVHLKKNFSDYPFEYEHFSTEFISNARLTAGDEVSAKKGAETDRERWGINYVIYVLGKLASFTNETKRASELYPTYQVTKKP